MEIVIIPCYDRPEYLQVCIEQIKKADNYDKYAYVFCMDSGFASKNVEIINNSGLYAYQYKTDRTIYREGKQSYNVLNGLSIGAENADNYVIYIEDDIFIGKDFFTFAEAIISHTTAPIAIMSKSTNNRINIKENNINAYYESSLADYQGLGVIFKKDFIISKIRPHCNYAYFTNIIGYVRKTFPNSKLNNNFAEQDGLIRRIIEKNNYNIAYSYIPRCYHAGLWGYHRFNDNKHKTYKDKVEFIKNTCFDAVKMKQYDKYNDSEPCDMNLSHEKVELIKI
jgi:hypothetical protein